MQRTTYKKQFLFWLFLSSVALMIRDLTFSVDHGRLTLLLVAPCDLAPQRLLRHRGAQGLLQPPGQALDLRLPLPHGLLGDGLGQLHDVRGPETVHQLVHLLLAVAGRLPHHQVAEVEVGTGVGQGEAVAGLDQWTEVSRQALLRRGGGLLTQLSFGKFRNPFAVLF